MAVRDLLICLEDGVSSILFLAYVTIEYKQTEGCKD